MYVADIVALLDESQDAETIALEIVSHDPLCTELEFVSDVISYDADCKTADDCIAIIIRELWDIAYSHGYYDGKVEAEEDIV